MEKNRHDHGYNIAITTHMTHTSTIYWLVTTRARRREGGIQDASERRLMEE